MNVIDCRKLDCPAPVIAVKKALAEQAEIRVLLDDGAPRENVSRFARNRGCLVTEERVGDAEWNLTITAPSEKTNLPEQNQAGGNKIILVTSNRIGDGPEELGTLLMKNFIHTLLETGQLPTRMFFLNSGVFLTCDGSDVLEALEKLAGMGVELLSCGLCLDFYKLKTQLRAGSVTNMLVTAENLLTADSVIKL
jgi:selenium metabolism protein YedF